MNSYKIIEQTKETYRAGLPKADPAWPPKVQRAVAFIIAHLFDPRLTVGWMKEQCGIYSHNFAGIFRKHLQGSPKEYIMKHRLAVAKQLLSDDALADIHIIDMALSIGFSTHAAFNMEFKKYMGSTPGEFRRAHRRT